MLKRAPRFLRVVELAGEFDALDQPDDSPKPTETIYAYEIVGTPGMCHINRGRNGSGFYPIATYKLVVEQPDEGVLRVTQSWQDWCMSKVKA